MFKLSLLEVEKKAVPRLDWSLLGVLFKISDEHPRRFHMGVPPGMSSDTKIALIARAFPQN